MNIRSASRFGRNPVTTLACALVAATLPAFVSAQGTGTVDGPTTPALILTDDAYSINAGDALAIVAPGVQANDKHAGIVVPRVVSLVAGTAHGSLALDQDGGFEYTPAKGFTGVDGFRYAVTAGGAYGEANVTLSVVSSIDLRLNIAAAPTADPGAPMTLTFTVFNQATVDANSMELQVLVSGPSGTGNSKSSGFNSSGCAASTSPNSAQMGWTCRASRIPGGGTYQASITLASNGPGTLTASAQVTSAELDSNPSDNAAAAEILVGRVSANPGRITSRQPWGSGSVATSVALALDNDSPLTLSYEANAVDQLSGNVAAPAWLSVSPARGQVDAYSSQSLTVSLSAAGQAPGLKRGLLHMVHDSPFQLADVPVSFTVAYLDVPAQRTDDPYVHALAGAGVTAGCRQGSFCPDAPLSRAGSTVWLLLAREGRSFQPAPAEGIFHDVRLARTEAGFIEELARRGVAEGCDADNFCPDAPLARADAAVMIVKMLAGVRYVPTATSGQPMFRDMRNDPRAVWVEDAVRRGVFSACSAGPRLFCPDQPLTRGDAAVSIVKAFNLPLN